MTAPHAALLMVPASAAGDPYWADVEILCHFDSSSGSGVSTTYVNESASGLLILTGGGAVTYPDVSSAQFKFGGFSLSYPASGNGSVYCASGAAGRPGTGDFTEEMFVYLNTITAAKFINDCRPSGGSANGYCLYCDGGTNSGNIMFVTNGIAAITANGIMAASQWMHVAISRTGGVSKLFVDGNQVGSDYADTNNYNATDTRVLGNAFNSSVASTSCFFDEWRLTIGVGRYTGNFTPPSAAFPDF